jgi:hypothetical protein
MSDTKIKRREFVKRAAYAAPVILTLKAMPAFAAAGSGNEARRRERRRSFFGGNQSDQAGSGSDQAGSGRGNRR